MRAFKPEGEDQMCKFNMKTTALRALCGSVYLTDTEFVHVAVESWRTRPARKINLTRRVKTRSKTDALEG
jgi:hypothetical protein